MTSLIIGETILWLIGYIHFTSSIAFQPLNIIGLQTTYLE